MTNLRVLAIDTSTEACSASLLWSDGEAKLRFELTERSHADLILPMVDSLLLEAGCRLRDLDGLAFGRGPGGFTGLRIAAGVIQGLALGAGLRVAAVSSLAAVAWLAQQPSPRPSPARAGEGILVCNDARMNEVYWGCYRFDASSPCAAVELTPERVGPQTSVEPAAMVRHFAGNGPSRYPALKARLLAAGLCLHDDLYPRADAVARLGAQRLLDGAGVSAADALPVYVRDEVARPSGPTVTGMS
jgi:tRNA threonylcarbamoyladenosine biosynthesis protein TsaB